MKQEKLEGKKNWIFEKRKIGRHWKLNFGNKKKIKDEENLIFDIRNIGKQGKFNFEDKKNRKTSKI